jgi:hypothetical protein
MFASARRSSKPGGTLRVALTAVLLVLASQSQTRTQDGPPLPGVAMRLWDAFPDAVVQDIVVDESGFTYVAGSGADGIFLRRYAQAGGPMWTRVFGSGGMDEGNAVAVHLSPTGSVIYVAGALDSNPSNSAADPRMFLRKYDSEGNELWTWTLDPSWDASRAYGVAVDASGQAYVAGEVQGGALGVIARVDPSGISDRRTFFAPQGGAGRLAITSVAVTSGGSVVAGGFVDGALVVGGGVVGSPTGGRDAFVVQMDNGIVNLEWGSVFGTPNHDEVRNAQVAADGSVYAVGAVDHGGTGRAFVRRYDAAGTTLWTREFGAPSTAAYDMALDPLQGTVSVVGASWPGPASSSAFLRQFNAEGTDIATYAIERGASFQSALGAARHDQRVLVVGAEWEPSTPPSSFAVEFSGLPVGLPEVHAFTNAATAVVGQIATMTGTYLDPNDGLVLSDPGGSVTLNGGATGTWTWSRLVTSVDQTGPVTIAGTDRAGLTASTTFQLTVLPYLAPTLSAAAGVVTVAPGETAVNTGTYLNAHGLAPSLTASVGIVTAAGGVTGTWSWSLPTDGSFTGGPVTISATDGGPIGTVTFDVRIRTMTLSLSSSANPSLAGEGVLFSATATSAVAGLPPPTGVVRFRDRTFAFDTPLVDGVATWEADPAVGTHSIDATYLGDDVYQAMTVSITQRVVDATSAGAPWIRQFGDTTHERSLAVAIDRATENVYATGVWNGHAFLRAYSHDGGELWTRHFTSTGSEIAHAVAVTPSGLIVVVGEVTGDLTGNFTERGSSSGGRDAFIRIYTDDGVARNTDQFGSGSDDIAYGVGVDSAGRSHVVGTTHGELPGQISQGGVDAFIRVDTDSAQHIWTRQFGSNTTDELFAATIDATGHLVATGYTGGAFLGEAPAGADDVLVTRWTSDGTMLWAHQYGSGLWERGQGVATDAAGNIYVAGSSQNGLPDQPSFGSTDAFIQKYDALGIRQWTRAFGTNGVDLVTGVAVDTAGNAQVVGHTSSATANPSVFVQAFSNDGAAGEAIAPTSGGFVVGTAIAADSAGGAVVAGYAIGALAGQTAAGGEDGWVARIGEGPAVFAQPVPQTVDAFETASFSARATGTPWPSVQWQVSTDGGATFSDLEGANAPILAFTALVGDDGRQYRAVFTNASGTAVSDSAALTVAPDAIPPVVTVQADFSVDALSPSGAAATFSASATDNVQGPLAASCSPASGSTFPVGSTTVTCTATDLSGNTAAGSFTITVIDLPPLIAAPGLPDVFTTPTATIDVQVTDTVGVGSVAVNGVSATLVAGTPQSGTWRAMVSVAIGALNSFDARAVDVGGNAASAQFWADGDGITAAIDRNRVTGSDESRIYSSDFKAGITAGTIVDRAGWTLEINESTDGPGGQVPGRSQISVRAVGLGGTARVAVCDGTHKEIHLDAPFERAVWSCGASGTLTVWAANALPAIRVAKTISFSFFGHVASITFDANVGAAQTYSTGSPFRADPANTEPIPVTIRDQSGETIGSFSIDPGDHADVSVTPDGTANADLVLDVIEGEVAFTIGSETTTLQAADLPVTVDADLAPPVITPPGDTVVEATSAAGAVVTFAVPTASDDSDPSPAVTVSHVSGSLFPIGDTTVTITAVDDADKVATASFVVRVRDTTPPEVLTSGDVSIEAQSSAGEMFTFASVGVDVVDVVVPATCEPASGTLFTLGTTTVTCTATDGSGNSGTATFTVTVVDRTVPVVTTSGDVTVEAVIASATPVTFSASAEDAHDGTLTASCFPASGSGFGLGTTTVTCTATDAAGNTGSATLHVTVEDTTAPSIEMLALPNGGVIWPPNGQMVPIDVDATATDAISVPVCAVTTIVSSEPTTSRGRNAGPDWLITGPLSVELRATRTGNGPGRVYTLTISCEDEAGNSTTGVVTATVPHDRGR